MPFIWSDRFSWRTIEEHRAAGGRRQLQIDNGWDGGGATLLSRCQGSTCGSCVLAHFLSLALRVFKCCILRVAVLHEIHKRSSAFP